MTDIIPKNDNDKLLERGGAFDEMTAFVAQTVAATSARVYGQTYALWRDFAAEHDLDALDLRPANVLAFVAGQDVTTATRQRHLTAMRQLARMLTVLDGSDETRRIYDALKLVKAPRQAAAAASLEREKSALTPSQTTRVLDVYAGAGDLLSLRNRAIVATLFLTGLRRAEVAALTWSDVDLERGIIHVTHGKGDKKRDVAIFGAAALDALTAWRDAQQLADDTPRRFVFCGVRKGGKLRDDKPATAQTVYRVIKHVQDVTGLYLTPHTARRTHLTEMLETGFTLADAQAQAGHASATTLLEHYVKSVDAERRRDAGRFRFGD